MDQQTTISRRATNATMTGQGTGTIPTIHRINPGSILWTADREVNGTLCWFGSSLHQYTTYQVSFAPNMNEIFDCKQ